MEIKQPSIGLSCTSFEPSSSNKKQSQNVVGSSSNSSHSEPKEIPGNETRQSLISLFLSHLNDERNTISQLTTVNGSKRFMLDSASAKSSLPERVNEINGTDQMNNSVGGSDLSSYVDKGNQPINFKNGSCNTVKANYVAHNKQGVDSKIVKPTTRGQFFFGGSAGDDRRFSLQFNQPSNTLHTGSNPVNCNQYEKIPLGRNKDHYCSTFSSPMNPVSYVAARTGPLNLGTSVNLTSADSLYISETTSASIHTKSIGYSHQLTDDNMRILAMRHMVDLSKQNQSTAALQVNPMHQKVCCHSGIELQRNLCRGDSTAPEDLRQRNYYDVRQNASDFAVIPLKSCSTCVSGNDAEIYAAAIGARGTNIIYEHYLRFCRHI